MRHRAAGGAGPRSRAASAGAAARTEPKGPLKDRSRVPRPDKASAAERLVAISRSASVFRAADGDTIYATIEVNGHQETYPVRSKGFRRWLSSRFYKSQNKPPGGQAFADALNVIEARGQF